MDFHNEANLKKHIRRTVTLEERMKAADTSIKTRLAVNFRQRELAAFINARQTDISNIERMSERAPTWAVQLLAGLPLPTPGETHQQVALRLIKASSAFLNEGDIL